MKLRSLLAATAAVSLAASPALAQSTFAPVTAESELSGENKGSGVLIAIISAVAIIAGIVILADNDDDAPTSP